MYDLLKTAKKSGFLSIGTGAATICEQFKKLISSHQDEKLYCPVCDTEFALSECFASSPVLVGCEYYCPYCGKTLDKKEPC